MLANPVLIVGPLNPLAASGLSAATRTLHLPEGSDQAAFLERHAGEIEALVLARAVDVPLVDRFPRLRIIANFGVGYDNLPTLHCASRGIIVTHTPHVLTDDVADTAMALMLMAVRRFGAAERYLRAGRWSAEGMFPLTGSLKGRTLGVLGLGRIGRAVARRAEGFGLPIAYHDIAPAPDLPYTFHASARELAKAVDILIAVLPGGPGTLRMVDAGVFEALGPDGIFVNVGRGTAVDQPALIAALQSGAIAGAGLDVYESEPGVPQALLDMEHVVLLPHVASGSHATREAMSRLVVDNITAFFTTGKALTPVPETPNPA
jgi:lactate dehydrogenase-like 2-hydroxyacid dehydrogenase